MKKIICAVICAVTVMQTAAFAKVNVPMSEALSAVKQKADIDTVFTEFESRTDKNEKGTVEYVFNWRDTENVKGVTIACDERGRINYYSAWNNGTDAEVRLSEYSKAIVQNQAEEIVEKLLPEMFAEDDVLVCDIEDIDAYLGNKGINYNLLFNRQKNGICVNENYVRVNIRAVQGSMAVNLRCNYDYDAQYEMSSKLINNPETAYKNAYPIALHYEDAEDENSTKLLYGIEKNGSGYISAATGELVKEKEQEFKTSGDKANSESSVMADASGDKEFSKQELAELEGTAGLKTEKEIENILRGLPELKMTEKMVLSSSNISKVKGKYVISLDFSDNENRYLYVSADAMDGTIYSIGNYDYSGKEKTELSQDSENRAKAKIKSFFEKVSLKSGEFTEKTSDTYSQNVGVRFVRKVNGVDYIDNRAYISYDAANDMINNYNITYTDMRFDDPKKAVNADDAYETLLKECPVMQEYVLTESDKYELCYRLKMPYTDIDALTGKAVLEKMAEYNDIGEHWSAFAVKALNEVGIRFCGDEFKPEEKVTKADLLKFFAQGIDGDRSLYQTAEFIPYMKRKGIVSNDTDGAATAKRSDAFVYMIKLAGYDKLAELDIYKVNYTDGAQMDNIGYAAILSGMGVICGDGGYLRPNDEITQAEAAVMLYNYLLKK